MRRFLPILPLSQKQRAADFARDAQFLEHFLRDGDARAFEQLMRWHEPGVFGVCRRILRNVQDAEDACQATFLVLARKSATISRRESLSGWLYTVACRISLRLKRRVARRTQRQLPLEDVADGRPGAEPPDQVAVHELRQWLDAELQQISGKYRTAFILCHLEGKTVEEATRLLGCPRGTVLSRAGRARQRLRARFCKGFRAG